MPLQFPSNPAIGETYQSGSSGVFVYNGEAWDTQTANLPITVTSASFAATASQALTASLALRSLDLVGTQPTYIQAGNASGQSIPANSLTTITGWTNTIAQNAAEWNATTGVFTATKAGTYLVSLGLSYSDVGAAGINREYACIITKNGFTVATGWAFTPLTNSVWRALSPVTTIVTVVPGDTITARAYQNITGGAVNLAARVDVNILTIQELPSRIQR